MQPADEINDSGTRLEGQTLTNGWIVGPMMKRPDYATGGCFSHGYTVTHPDGRTGFLKVIDYSHAMRHPDPALILNSMTQAFLFERKLCELCTKKSMTRVVRAIDAGTMRLDSGFHNVMQYLIFELAEGDVRKHLTVIKSFDDAGALRALHHTCTGLFQLHNSGIAHQDLKPSNMLHFKDEVWKVADLGRASSLGHNAPHDGFPFAGDAGYAPPELLYGQGSDDWAPRRFGCDAYLLGSMILFMFTGAGMTAQLVDQIDPRLHYTMWGGSYEEVLPYLRDAFGRSLRTAHAALPEHSRDDLLEMISQLCDPDPKLRGHPELRGRIGNQYSLERYVSRLNLLASKAEVGLKRGFKS